MCGRFPQSQAARDHARLLAMREEMEAPRPETWNVAPTTSALVVRAASESLSSAWLTWGFREAALVINARIETAASKPLFHKAWRERRCIVPVDGWYEWAKVESGKQPYYFYQKGGDPLCLAGLWTDEAFVLLTSGAEAELSQIHHRRPVALSVDRAREWIEQEPSSVNTLLEVSTPESTIAFHPVSPRVNSPRHDGRELIEAVPVSTEPRQVDLF